MLKQLRLLKCGNRRILNQLFLLELERLVVWVGTRNQVGGVESAAHLGAVEVSVCVRKLEDLFGSLRVELAEREVRLAPGHVPRLGPTDDECRPRLGQRVDAFPDLRQEELLRPRRNTKF